MSSTYKYLIQRLLAVVYTNIFQGFNCGLVLSGGFVCVCYLQTLKMNGLRLKLVFKEGKNTGNVYPYAIQYSTVYRLSNPGD